MKFLKLHENGIWEALFFQNYVSFLKSFLFVYLYERNILTKKQFNIVPLQFVTYANLVNTLPKNSW
jgi:hypothetical protein